MNPVAAGLAATAEDSTHTLLRAGSTTTGPIAPLGRCTTIFTLTCNQAQEADLWLMPIDDHHSRGDSQAVG